MTMMYFRHIVLRQRMFQRQLSVDLHKRSCLNCAEGFTAAVLLLYGLLEFVFLCVDSNIYVGTV